MRNSVELPTKTPQPTDEEGSSKRKAAKLPKNVILRGNRYYIRIPGKAGSKERVRVATFITAGGRGADAAAKLLAQVELLTGMHPPRWNLLNALHDGMLTLSEFNELMITQGVSAVEQRVADEVRRRQEDRSLPALASDWPALYPGSKVRPEKATIKLRQARVKHFAETIGTMGKLTHAAVQRYIDSCGGPATQRAYRNDIAKFCDWLIDQGLLGTNPVEGVVVDKLLAGDQRIRFREFSDLMLVYHEMPQAPPRDAFGFMIATAAETSMCEKITPEHADRYREVNVPGRKTGARNRQAVIEAWFVPRWKELLESTPPGQKMMPANRFEIAKEVKKAVSRLIARDATLTRLSDLSPYDARHAWAVRWLRDKGATIGMVSAQLGHVNNQMVAKHYGRWIPKTAAVLALDPEPEATE